MENHAHPLPILTGQSWGALSADLEAVAGLGGALRAAHDALVRPLRLLDLMARDAPAALGDDVAAAERLRLLLQLAAPYGSLLAHVKKLVRIGGAPERRQYEPGVLDLGTLALVALAAVRISPPAEAEAAVRAVHGAALSAAPAEALGRLRRPHGPDGLATVLGTLYLLEQVGSALDAPFLRPFAADPAERARWAALEMVLEQRLPAALEAARGAAEVTAERAWDGASAEAILEVPHASRPGEALVIRGGFKELVWRGRLRPGIRAVLATPETVTPLRVVRASSREVEVKLPRGAPPGWLGFSLDEAIDRSNDFRRALRVKLARLEAEGATVPAQLLPLLERPDPERPGAHLAMPPRRAIGACQGSPAPNRARRARPGARPRIVLVRLRTVELLPASAGASRRPAGPVPSWRDVAQAWARPPIALRARRGRAGPAALNVEEARVGRAVDREELDATLRAADVGAWREAEVLEVPWVDDGLAATLGPIRGHDDPRLTGLLELLARRALVTPGLEDAVWLGLLPPEPGGSIWRASPADAGRAVAVADLTGLPALLAGLQTLPPPAPPAPRLRLLASWDGDRLALHGARYEERRAGPGAPHPSGILAVARDAGGEALSAAQLQLLAPPSGGRPAALAALVPITPEVEAIELWREGALLHRIARRQAQAELWLARLGPRRDGAAQRLTWSWRGGRSTFELALERRGVVTPVLPLAGLEAQDVRLTRYAGADRLLVLGSDGWNTASRAVESAEEEGSAVAFENPFPVAIRRVAHGRYFADVPEGWSARWSLAGGPPREGLAVRLAAGARGTLVLEARSPGGERCIRDERAVPAEVT